MIIDDAVSCDLVRRADRLFHIIQLLRSRRTAATARWLAERLEVSERTIYRDIRDLAQTGTPIEGAAGIGYSMRSGYDLPPLMFDAEEIEALVLGARVVAAFGDRQLTRAAARALSKVENVLPRRLKPKLTESTLFAPRTAVGRRNDEALATVRAAIASRNKLAIAYARDDGEKSERVVRPLAASFWGRSWTMTAWCELRDDFRTFRLDRIERISIAEATFADEPGRSLADYFDSIGVDPKSAGEI